MLYFLCYNRHCSIFFLLDVERLRREHRIVGHLSTAPSKAGSSGPSVSLPLLLTFEETVFLLFRHIVPGLDCVKPVHRLPPPSPRTLARYDRDLSQHLTESVRVKVTFARRNFIVKSAQDGVYYIHF